MKKREGISLSFICFKLRILWLTTTIILLIITTRSLIFSILLLIIGALLLLLIITTLTLFFRRNWLIISIKTIYTNSYYIMSCSLSCRKLLKLKISLKSALLLSCLNLFRSSKLPLSSRINKLFLFTTIRTNNRGNIQSTTLTKILRINCLLENYSMSIIMSSLLRIKILPVSINCGKIIN